MNGPASTGHQCESIRRTADGPQSFRVVLPDYRGPYAANDFNDLELRAMDQAITDFLSQQAPLAWWRGERKIIFQIPATKRDPDKEQTTKQAYRDLFRDLAMAHWRKCARQIPRTIALVTLGLVILLISQQIGDANMERPLRHALSDAVSVGGWVAMWTAFAAVFFEAGQALHKYYVFRRLARLPIGFDYSTSGTSLDSQPSRGPHDGEAAPVAMESGKPEELLR